MTLAAADKRASIRRIHWAWVVAAVSFVAILGAAGFRSVPGVMMGPLHHEFGWSHGVVGLAMSVNMMLFGVTLEQEAEAGHSLMHRIAMHEVLAELCDEGKDRDGQHLHQPHRVDARERVPDHDERGDRRQCEMQPAVVARAHALAMVLPVFVNFGRDHEL